MALLRQTPQTPDPILTENGNIVAFAVKNEI